MDTNSDPDGINFPIPGNDDARRSIDLYCNLIKETIENAKKSRHLSLSKKKKETKSNLDKNKTIQKNSHHPKKILERKLIKYE